MHEIFSWDSIAVSILCIVFSIFLIWIVYFNDESKILENSLVKFDYLFIYSSIKCNTVQAVECELVVIVTWFRTMKLERVSFWNEIRLLSYHGKLDSIVSLEVSFPATCKQERRKCL